MRSRQWLIRGIGIFLAVLHVAGIARAQSATTAAIAGTVRDTTGAVLPGVTVEAASPALIEKVRSVITDSQGLYKIVELPPGPYTVTFTLVGFSVVKQEGLTLSAGATAPINGELKVGSLEETLTVTGVQPMVDVQNVRTQNVLPNQVLTALPSGLRDLTQFASMTLGAAPSSTNRNDVGGSQAEQTGGIVINGTHSHDGQALWDGADTSILNINGGSNSRSLRFNQMAVQEVVLDTGGASAETVTGGANLNMVPKEGGNSVSGSLLGNWTSKSFSSGKVPDDLIARGSAPDQNTMKHVYDVGGSVGGRIVRDRLWYFGAVRWWGNEAYVANSYFNKSTDWRFFEPDLNRQAHSYAWVQDQSARFTWQASSKHKFMFAETHQKGARSVDGNNPEATLTVFYDPMWLTQAGWTYAASNKLLFQAHYSNFINNIEFSNWVNRQPQYPSVLELTGTATTPANFRYNAVAGSLNSYADPQGGDNDNQRVSMSYISGAHAFKVGLQGMQGLWASHGRVPPNSTNYTFVGGRPQSVTQFATPFENTILLRSIGLFAQDQWTINRLTLNLGLRYDRFWTVVPAITVPAGPFVPERSYPEVRNQPNYQDLSPRIGVSYDVFGNGKTAIKGAFGRYLAGVASKNTVLVSPALATVTNANRTWTDGNGNYVPDCDLTNVLANGECGNMSNLNFGRPTGNFAWDQDSREGWGIREYSYQWSVELQHELRPRLGINLSYHRTQWFNQLAQVNTAVSPSDFTSYCVTAPTDPRLDAVSGQRVCGIYNVNPSAFGRVNNLLMLAKDVPGADGTPEEIYNGVDMAANWRFGDGGLLSGGLSLGRTTFDQCWLNNLPNAAQIMGSGPPTSLPTSLCRTESPWWNGVGTGAKAQFVLPLPQAVTLAGTFKNIPGVAMAATYVVTNAVASQELGRNLAGCPAVGACNQTQLVPILPEVNSEGNRAAVKFDDRLTQVDLRVARAFRIARLRINPTLDLYNIFNVRTPQLIITTYGPTWTLPTALLGGRTFKIGSTIDF